MTRGRLAFILSTVFAAAMLAALLACTEGELRSPNPVVEVPEEPPPPDEISLREDVMPIIQINHTCHRAGCHDLTEPQTCGADKRMDFRTADAFHASLVGVLGCAMCVDDNGPMLRVKAGDAAGSCLPILLELGLMPLDCQTLSINCLTEDEIDVIKAWIDAGAPNN